MKLEAIVLAAGSGSRMVELSRGRPKCLLPVGNQSLIWFSITNLRTVGVNRILILVPDIHEAEIKQYCHKKFNSLKDLSLEFFAISTEAGCGTAESLLSIRDKIRGDFIVHSCDSIVDPKALRSAVNHYRLYDPMLTMILADNAKYFERRSVPGRQEKERPLRDIIAIEPLDKLDLTAEDGFSAHKVVFLHSERDLKQNLRIRSRELVLHPSLSVCSNFMDAHIYIFKHQVLEFMKQNQDIAVLKGEMIPKLISKQYNRSKQSCDDTIEDDEIPLARNHLDYEIELKEKLESFNPRNFTQSKKANIPIPTACHVLLVKNLIAYRVNTVRSYLDSNIDAKLILGAFGLKNLNSVKDRLIGENTTVGDKCQIKRGSIGNNCKIGDKVKLFDCVIMDNVEIDSNTSLSECIVGSHAKIGLKCDLKSCIVGHKQVVPANRKVSGEIIIDDGYAIDLSDPIIAEGD